VASSGPGADGLAKGSCELGLRRKLGHEGAQAAGLAGAGVGGLLQSGLLG
jgi:hypothetical protein